MSQIAAFVLSQSGCAISPDIRNKPSMRELDVDHNRDRCCMKAIVIFTSAILLVSGSDV